MSFHIIDMPGDPHLQHVAARTCVEYWQRDFPLDTDEWYLNLYAESLATSSLPIVLVAIDGQKFLGTASLIADDELPNASEPGPWVAAVFVAESHRRQGIGTALISTLQRRAATLGLTEVFLYTENGMSWYESMGWQRRRIASLGNHDVTVMSRHVSGLN